MARNKGTFNFSANLQVKMAEALDPRIVVSTKTELITKETWPYDGDTLYLYKGLIVAVAEDKSIFMLIDPSKALESDYSGWKQMDVSAQQTIEIIDSLTYPSTTAALSANQGYILKQNIDALGSKLTSVYRYKGSLQNFSDLDPVTSEGAIGRAVGDVWNIVNEFEIDGKKYPAGTNVARTDTGWDPLGGSIDLSEYYTKSEADSTYVKKDSSGNILLEGTSIKKEINEIPTDILSVSTNNDVSLGTTVASTVLKGNTKQPSYSYLVEGTANTTQLVTQETLDATKTELTEAVNTKISELDINSYVKKEVGKSLISDEKLALIDTNSSNITNINQELSTIKSSVNSSLKTTVNSLVSSIDTAEAGTESILIKYSQIVKKENSEKSEYIIGNQMSLELPAATTTTAGVMTKQDKTDLNNVITSLTWQQI